jgi:hypothetical protein
MRDGEIHEAALTFQGQDIERIKEQPNLLLVVNFQDDESAAAVSKPPEPEAAPIVGGDIGARKPVALVSVANYTLERAVGDSIIYHQACSLTEGLIEAEYSINSFEQIDRLRGTEEGANVIQDIARQRRAIDDAATGGPAN